MHLLKKKLSITQFSITQLLELNLHVGSLKKYRHSHNIDLLYNTPKKLDIIKLDKTIYILKKTLPLITNIVSNGGKILIIFNTSHKPFCNHLLMSTKFLKQKILFSWKPGILSNFKEFKKQKKYLSKKNIVTLPHFICFLTNYFLKDFKTEIKSFNIPALTLHNTQHENFGFLYSIPGNNNTYNIKLFFFTLFKTAIINGYTKKILKFSHLKYKKKIKIFSSIKKKLTV